MSAGGDEEEVGGGGSRWLGAVMSGGDGVRWIGGWRVVVEMKNDEWRWWRGSMEMPGGGVVVVAASGRVGDGGGDR